MLKLTSSAAALIFAASAAADGQVGRARPDAGGRADRAPLVLLDSTRERDGLRGPVRRVETEVAAVDLRRGELQSRPPSLLERTLYDERGRRVENETYPVVGSRGGQETHKYDARGNVTETVVRDPGGAVLSRTAYEYEFDQFGNWIKMTASVAVSKAGKIEYEPVEVTRRAITYYLVDEPADQNSPGGARQRAGADLVEAARVGERASPTPAAARRQAGTAGSPVGAELIDAGVLNDRATWLPRPAFPVTGRRLDVPITVPVEVVFDITGRVVSARALGGPEALRDSAERAARLAAFLPVYVAGRPVRAKGLINYTFNFLP